MKCLFFLLLFSNTCLAQGYIINAGFEPIPKDFAKEYSIEQQVLRRFGRGCETCLHDWIVSGPFADMNNAFLDEPQKEHPKKYFGESFASITFYSNDLSEKTVQSGYLETKLKKPLQAGRRYEVSFQIALSRNLSNYSTNKMGMYFGEHELKLDSILPLSPQILMEEIVDTSGEYVLFKDTFIASASYKFLVLGYFPKGITLKKQYRRADLNGIDIDRTKYDKHINARYSIDEIAIRELSNAEALETDIRSRIDLRNIQFESGKAVLLESAKPELLKLSAWLQTNKEVRLRIEGHTDDLGEIGANQLLSEDRAKAIMQFLVSQGINKSRVEAVGFGEAMPIVQNSSDENRALNRRVEIKVID